MSKHLPPKKNKHEAPEGKNIFNIPLRERKTAHTKNELSDTGRKNLVFIVPAALFVVLGLVLPVEGWLEILLFAIALVLAGFQVALKAVDKAMSLHFLEGDVLIIVACLMSFALGSYWASGLLMLVYRVLRLIEGRLDADAQKLNSELHSFRPVTARIVTGEVTNETEPGQVAQDDILEVRPGEIFPVDGYVLEGVSSIDASPLTGCGPVRTIGVGTAVWSGCINSSGAVKMKADRIYAESAASTISELLERALRYKSRGEKFALTIERHFTPVLVILAVVIALLPPIFSGEWSLWLERSAVFFALAAFCPLSNALSHVLRRALVWAGKRGIVFKGSCFFETVGAAQTFVFNKTGTLTEGRYVVTEIVPTGMSTTEFLTLAAQVESVSNHPIARAICWANGDTGDALRIKAEEYEGRGIEALVNDTEIILGNAILLHEHGIECSVTPKGSSAIHMSVNGRYAGYMLLVDKIRDSAFDQLEALRVKGVKNMITLTADMRSVARPLASSLNMEMVRAELSAEGKVSALEYLMATKAEHSTLAFVSDGEGDPEALKRADVGISFGALGHYEAYEPADVLILEDRLSALSDMMGISIRVCRSEIISLLAFILIKFAVIALTFSGLGGIAITALGEFVLALLLCAVSLNISNYTNDTRRKK